MTHLLKESTIKELNATEGATVTNRVCADKSITVEAVSADPTDTVICGAPDPNTGNHGAAAVRGVYLAGGAKLMGFTVSNGYCKAWASGNRGCGVYAQTTATVIKNGVVAMNSAYQGGGIYYNQQGWRYDRLISIFILGRRVYAGISTNCLISFNVGTTAPGSTTAYDYDCQITTNTTTVTGGSGGGGLTALFTAAKSALITASSMAAGGTMQRWYREAVSYIIIRLGAEAVRISRRWRGIARSDKIVPAVMAVAAMRGHTTIARSSVTRVAPTGGGTRDGIFDRCEFRGNSGRTGGAYGGILRNCRSLTTWAAMRAAAAIM